MEGLKARWNELQPRERVMLVMMFVVFGALGLFVLYVLISSAFDARAEEIAKYRQALYYLEDTQADYAANKTTKEQMHQKLLSNDLKVSHFLSQTATDLGFDVSVTPKEPRKASAEDASGAEEQEFDITVKTVERDQLLEYLFAIDHVDAPVFIRRIDIRRSRGRGAGTATDTPLTASLTVVSYRMKE